MATSYTAFFALTTGELSDIAIDQIELYGAMHLFRTEYVFLDQDNDGLGKPKFYTLPL